MSNKITVNNNNKNASNEELQPRTTKERKNIRQHRKTLYTYYNTKIGIMQCVVNDNWKEQPCRKLTPSYIHTAT